MGRTGNLLLGTALGAGLMYLLDPDSGRRRRALARDQFFSLQNDLEKAACVVSKDMQNRAQGVAAGDWTALIGGKRALEHPFEGNFSPSARAIMGGLGAGLVLYGLTRRAPMACIMGTVGLLLTTEAATNASVEDIQHIPERLSETISQTKQQIADTLSQHN